VPDHYTLLGVARSAAAKEIKAAYRRLIAQYHPDLNPDPKASDITARLNEAYAVLSDEDKRRLYDADLDPDGVLQTAAQSTWNAAAGPFPRTHCQNCGRQDSTLRISQFFYSLSFLFFTRSRATKGVWCETCRVVESAKWTFLSGFAGWWGIPWGPLRTMRDLAVNSRGGKQSARGNSALLRSLGYDFYGRGDYDEAVRALQESLRFQSDPEVKELLDQLQSRFAAPASSRMPSSWTLAQAIPVLILAVIWAGFIEVAASRLGRYRTNHPASSTSSLHSSRAPSAITESVRDLVRLQINRLASIVADRSPRLGTHYDGSTLVADYGLDRSRYDAAVLYPIAQAIGKEFKPGTSDPNGFLASAYFNSMLFALSVDIVNRIYEGVNIEAQAAQAGALGKDPRVSAWLHGSQLWPGYQTLQTALQTSVQSYKPGQSLEKMEGQAELMESTLQHLEAQQTLFQAEQDIDGYNRLVPVYDRDLDRLKMLTHQIQAQLAVAKELDIAFNRCLNGSILLGKLEHVHFTSGGSKIERSP